MKFLVAIALAVACAHADVSHVVGQDAAAQVVKYESDVQPNAYNYVYETSNGIFASANGIVKNENSESAAQEVRGQFRYPGPDGVNYEITYVADENGYQPQGAHLPVPPPIPELIARSLEYNAAHPQAEDKYVNTGARAVASVAAAVPIVPKPYNKPVSKPFGSSNRRF